MEISRIGSQPNLNVSVPEGEVSKIKVGQTVKATILNVTPDEVTLKLDDGSTMSAKVLSSLDAAIGDNVEFVVKDKNQGQFILQTTKNADISSGKLDDIKDLLFNLKIPMSDKNIDIVQNLMNLKMPVSGENIKLASNIMSNFENINPQKAVFMIANKIAPQEKNVNLLNSNIAKDVFKNEFNNLENSIINIKDSNIKSQILDILNSGDLKNNLKIQEFKDTLKTVLSGKVTNNDNIIKDISDNIASVVDELPDTIKDALFIDDDSINNQFKNTLKSLEQNSKEISDTIEKYSNKQLSQEEVTEKLDNLLSPIKNNISKDINDIFDKIKNNLHSKKEHTDIDSALKKAINDISIKVTRDLDSKDLNVSDLYKDIYRKLESVKAKLSEEGSSEELKNSITNIQENIKFANNINNNMAYIPIPLNIDNNRSTGQLYVLKHNKNSKIDPQNASLYLALHMPSLGAVGILVNVDRKNISLNFKSESDKSIDVIRNNYPKLIEVLNNKSYNVQDVTFSVFNNEINMLNVTNVLGDKVKTRTFDIRV